MITLKSRPEIKQIVWPCAIAAMMCGVAAWADKPEQYPIEPTQITGEFLADCGDFLVLTDYRLEGFGRNYFNEDGSPNRIFLRFDAVDSIYYNSEDPSYWVAGSGEHAQFWIHFKDGEPINQVATGPSYKVTVPGYGAVFMAVGRVHFDYTTGEVTFQAGQADILGNFDAICAALRPQHECVVSSQRPRPRAGVSLSAQSHPA